MITRDFQGAQLPMFAMGCMRLPVRDSFKDIDEEQVAKMVALAMERGVTYYDTAYGYHDGMSEVVMGRVLSAYPRESYMLADKFPGYDSSNWGKVEEIFEEQLERCGVDYFDFYLFHNVYEGNVDAYLDEEKYGIYDYLMKQKQNGRIKHLGFSIHGSMEVLDKFLDAYGKDMEFCQVQLNYIDYTFQDAKAKLDRLAEWNIPVWVMEPLRGGMLAKATDEEMQKLDQVRPGETPVGWALRYLQSLDQVKLVLCGSSTEEQNRQNLDLFAEENPLTEEQMQVLLQIAQDRLSKDIMPCTACRYCTAHCPQEIDIPAMMELYNEHKFTGGGFLAPMAIAIIEEGKRPADCIACGACVEVCPQQIDIPGALEDFVKILS